MAGLHAEVISDTHLNLWKYKPEQIAAIFPGVPPSFSFLINVEAPTTCSVLDLAADARSAPERDQTPSACATPAGRMLGGSLPLSLPMLRWWGRTSRAAVMPSGHAMARPWLCLCRV